MAYPKVKKIESLANILIITFTDNTTRYLKSNWKHIQKNTSKKEKMKPTSLFSMNANLWLGSTYKIDKNGDVLVNNSEKYTANELWYSPALMKLEIYLVLKIKLLF